MARSLILSKQEPDHVDMVTWVLNTITRTLYPLRDFGDVSLMSVYHRPSVPAVMNAVL